MVQHFRCLCSSPSGLLQARFAGDLHYLHTFEHVDGFSCSPPLDYLLPSKGRERGACHAHRVFCRSVPLQALRRVSPTARLKARAQCSWEFGWNTAVENSWPASKVAAVAVGTSVRHATLRLRCWAVRGLEVRVRCAAPGTSQRSATINPSTSKRQRCRTP